MILTVLSLSVNLSAAVIGSSDALSEHLQRAYESYLQGEAATTVSDKEQDFNRALRLFSQLEGEPGNGKLYYNIGNTYYQLEQYGWSILYYLRAQRLLPRDQKVQFLLTMAEAQQNLPITTESRWVSLFFFWHLKMSQVERIQAFMAFCVALLLFGSLFIWYRSGLLKILTALSGIAASVLLVSILYFHYFAPVQAVIVNAFGYIMVQEKTMPSLATNSLFLEPS